LTAAYRQLLEAEALKEKSRKAHARLSCCDLCTPPPQTTSPWIPIRGQSRQSGRLIPLRL